MSKVSITVNDRAFSVGCEPGQEEHVRKLGKVFNTKVSDLVRQVGQIGDLRLFLMASLVIADELEEARQKLAKADPSAHKKDEKAMAAKIDKMEAKAVDTLEKAAAQVEALLQQLDDPAT